MSYTEDDAWLDEKARGDWPFDRWVLPTLSMRDGHDYFETHRLSTGIGSLFYRAREPMRGSEGRLATLLEAAREVVDRAVEQSEYEAKSCWLHHKVWLPMIDELLEGTDEVAELVVECLDLVGPAPDTTESDILAAVALWSFGEWSFYETRGDQKMQHWSLLQAAVAIAQLEYRRGLKEETRRIEVSVAQRNRRAAAERHKPNRQNKERGRELWAASAWRVQADAERAIAAECHITKEVAARWVREFKRAR